VKAFHLSTTCWSHIGPIKEKTQGDPSRKHHRQGRAGKGRAGHNRGAIKQHNRQGVLLLHKQEAPQAGQGRAGQGRAGQDRIEQRSSKQAEGGGHTSSCDDLPISIASQLSCLLPAHGLTSLTHLSIAKLTKARSAALA